MIPIYLDHASTTTVGDMLPEVYTPSSWLEDGNPNSIHQLGINASKKIKKVEELLMEDIGAESGKIVFFQSASLANFFAAKHFFVGNSPYYYGISSLLEHKSIIQASIIPYPFYLLPVTSTGIVNINPINQYRASGSSYKPTCFFQLVNSETGVIQPIRELRDKYYPEEKYLFYCDAVQGYKKLPINVHTLGCDFLTISAHKIYGPKGIAAMWMSENVIKRYPVIPHIGTLNPSLIQGLGAAITSLDREAYVQMLTRSEETFLEALNANKVSFEQNFPKDRVPGLLSLFFPEIQADQLMMELSDRGVYISTGSACNKTKYSPVLVACGMSNPRIESTVRISLGYLSQGREVEAAEIIAMTIKGMTQ